jgi:hypothetical protein
LRKLSIVVALVLLSSCATTKKPPMKAPEWTSIPPLVTEALCARAHSEAIPTAAAIAVIRTTQPLITARAVNSLAHAYWKQTNLSVQVADELGRSVTQLPVTITNSGSCLFEALDASEKRRDSDELLLQVSSPFVNPFTRGEAGLFARISLGDREPSWYWVPLAERNGHWLIGGVMLLDLHEE